MGEKGLFYKDRPLVRCANRIFYGAKNDKYYVEMTILEKTTIVDIEVSTKISMELVRNIDGENKEVIKRAEFDGIYSAVDSADSWLVEAFSGA